MKFGTLSFQAAETDHGLNIVPDGADRVEAILGIIKERKPDVLIGAGFTLDNCDQLHDLGSGLSAANSKTAVVVEIKNDSKGSSAKNPDGIHRVYVWLGKEWKGMPHQILVEGADADNQALVERLEQGLPDRTFQTGGLKLGVLVCGEIGIVRGARGIQSAETRDWVDGLNVVLNPTHTRMSYSGRLEEKRATLGRDGRLYVSVSNWVIHDGGRQRPPDTLQTVYRDGSRDNGNMISVGFGGQFPLKEDEFVYREYNWDD